METYRDLLQFIKKPEYQQIEGWDLKTRISLLVKLLALSLLLSFTIAIILSALENITDLDLGEHAINLLFEEYSPVFILLVVAVLAPIIEELIFRGPLYLFRNNRYFGIIFYLITLIFGFYHITNFEINPTVIYLAPLLVSPQLFIGLILGYVRVKLGLIWAMLLHSIYNIVLVGPIVLAHILEIPIQ
ncbi:MAG: CPBP family intramembrane glutamic endopeptidase [Flavobacteriaceae bacterium]